MELASEIRTYSTLILMLLSTLFWCSVYLYTYNKYQGKKKDHFSNNAFWSNVHSIVGLLLATLSLLSFNLNWNTTSHYFEILLLSWVTGYFIIDVIDCIIQKSIMFLVHGIIGWMLLYATSSNPFFALRTASKGYYIELSNPFYLHWKTKNRTKTFFGVFCVVFFLCRIVYTPLFLYSIFADLDSQNNWFAILASLAFYIINWIWFVNGAIMFFQYKEDNAKKIT